MQNFVSFCRFIQKFYGSNLWGLVIPKHHVDLEIVEIFTLKATQADW